jgi:hypothetical protein
MMAWILVSLLATVASDAVVDFSPELNAAPPASADGGDGFPGPPPK